MKFLWKVLIAVGAILVLLAFAMDTSVESGGTRVHNLGLQAQQQMILITGCFLFMGGIVLYAVKSMNAASDKQSLEGRAAEKRALEKTPDQHQVRHIPEAGVEGLVVDMGALEHRFEMLLSKFKGRSYNAPGRLCAALAVGLLWRMHADQLADSTDVGLSTGVGLMLMLPVLAYSLWPQPWRAIIVRLALANVVFLIVTCLAWFIFTDVMIKDFLSPQNGRLVLVQFFALPALLSLVLVRFVSRKSR